MTALQFIILVLAVHRVTHLFVEDSIPIVSAPREWISRKTQNGKLQSIGYLVNCFWCSSVWIAAAAVLVLRESTFLAPEWTDGILAPLLLGAGLSTAATTLETAIQAGDAYIIKHGG